MFSASAGSPASREVCNFMGITNQAARYPMKDPITSLLKLLYVFVVDYVTNGANGRSHEVFDHLREAYRTADPMYKKRLQPELDDAMRAAGKNPDAKTLAYAALGMTLKNVIPEIVHDRGITAQQVELFKALGLYLRSDSPPALAKLSKLALSATHDSWIAQKLAKEDIPQQDDGKLRFLVRKLTGRDDVKLTMDEAVRTKTRFPKMYKDYLALRKVFSQNWKDALQTFVSQSGGRLVPMKQFEQFCKKNGIETTLPTGFDGMIDDLGRFYTRDQRLINGVPNTTTFPSVMMNKNFGKINGGDWVFMALREGGGLGPYYYTVDYQKDQREKKFQKVQSFGKVIDGMHKKWFTKVKSFDPTDPKCVVATILEILYLFSARIGSRGNAANGEPTFGISTLLVKHIYPQSNGDVFIRYNGKDGVATKHVLRANDPIQKFVIANLMHLIDGKKPRDPVFTVQKGNREVPINSGQVNGYFSSLGAPDGVTVHKLRTRRGTEIARAWVDAQMEKGPRSQPKDQRSALELLKQMAMKVGKELNHVRRSATGVQTITPSTALQNYVDPLVIREVYDFWTIRYPPFLEKLLGVGI